jgi:hypothetical protein
MLAFRSRPAYTQQRRISHITDSPNLIAIMGTAESVLPRDRQPAERLGSSIEQAGQEEGSRLLSVRTRLTPQHPGCGGIS